MRGADLLLATSAGVVDDFSPPPEVSVSNGLAAVKYVPQTISGDVNCDGKVTPSDVIQALGYSLGSVRRFAGATAISTATGFIEAGDALAMLDFLSGIEAALPGGCPGTG